jgi:hypothetical protein
LSWCDNEVLAKHRFPRSPCGAPTQHIGITYRSLRCPYSAIPTAPRSRREMSLRSHSLATGAARFAQTIAPQRLMSDRCPTRARLRLPRLLL